MLSALAAGCLPPERGIQGRGPTGGEHAVPRRSVIGSSVQGRPIECVTLGYGGDATLIIATIHGNEPAGTPLVERLIEHLAARPALLRGRQVMIVPVSNPDGYEADDRHNARGVDLNRNFPASNFASLDGHGNGPLSEPESRALHRLLETYPPDRVISIHQPTSLPACIDYDGPAQALAETMADYCDLPVKKLGSRPGSLGSYVGMTLGRPIITLEIPRFPADRNGDALWERYGRMMMAAILFPYPP